MPVRHPASTSSRTHGPRRQKGRGGTDSRPRCCGFPTSPSCPCPDGSPMAAHWPFTRALVLALRCRDRLCSFALRSLLSQLTRSGSDKPSPPPQSQNRCAISLLSVCCVTCVSRSENQDPMRHDLSRPCGVIFWMFGRLAIGPWRRGTSALQPPVCRKWMPGPPPPRPRPDGVLTATPRPGH